MPPGIASASFGVGGHGAFARWIECTCLSEYHQTLHCSDQSAPSTSPKAFAAPIWAPTVSLSVHNHHCVPVIVITFLVVFVLGSWPKSRRYRPTVQVKQRFRRIKDASWAAVQDCFILLRSECISGAFSVCKSFCWLFLVAEFLITELQPNLFFFGLT